MPDLEGGFLEGKDLEDSQKTGDWAKAKGIWGS